MHVIHVMLLNVYFSKSTQTRSSTHTLQRNSTNASPRLTSSDLGLDPSDPLNLLLHNTSQRSSNASGDSSMEDSSQGGSPPTGPNSPTSGHPTSTVPTSPTKANT